MYAHRLWINGSNDHSSSPLLAHLEDLLPKVPLESSPWRIANPKMKSSPKHRVTVALYVASTRATCLHRPTVATLIVPAKMDGKSHLQSHRSTRPGPLGTGRHQ